MTEQEWAVTSSNWPDTDDIKLYSSGAITTNYLPDLVRKAFQMNNEEVCKHYNGGICECPDAPIIHAKECVFDDNSRLGRMVPRWSDCLMYSPTDEPSDVTRQSHYMNLKIQPLIVMMNDLSNDEFKGYLKGNIIKYVLRAERKNGNEDYAKAAFYAKLLDEFVRTGTITLPGA